MSSKKADAKRDAAKGQDELIQFAYQSIGKLDSLLAQMSNFYDESGTGSNSKPLAERLRRADQDRRYTEREILDGIRAIQNALKVALKTLKAQQDAIECDLAEAKVRNERLREENLQLRLQVEALTSAQDKNVPREWHNYVDRKLDRLLDAVSDVTRLVDSTGKAGSFDPSLLNR